MSKAKVLLATTLALGLGVSTVAPVVSEAKTTVTKKAVKVLKLGVAMKERTTLGATNSYTFTPSKTGFYVIDFNDDSIESTETTFTIENSKNLEVYKLARKSGKIEDFKKNIILKAGQKYTISVKTAKVGGKSNSVVNTELKLSSQSVYEVYTMQLYGQESFDQHLNNAGEPNYNTGGINLNDNPNGSVLEDTNNVGSYTMQQNYDAKYKFELQTVATAVTLQARNIKTGKTINLPLSSSDNVKGVGLTKGVFNVNLKELGKYRLKLTFKNKEGSTYSTESSHEVIPKQSLKGVGFKFSSLVSNNGEAIGVSITGNKNPYLTYTYEIQSLTGGIVYREHTERRYYYTPLVPEGKYLVKIKVSQANGQVLGTVSKTVEFK